MFTYINIFKVEKDKFCVHVSSYMQDPYTSWQIILLRIRATRSCIIFLCSVQDLDCATALRGTVTPSSTSTREHRTPVGSTGTKNKF